VRDECLNENWFTSLDQARTIIEDWRMDYNTERPHTSLGDLAPEEFARQQKPGLMKPEILNLGLG